MFPIRLPILLLLLTLPKYLMAVEVQESTNALVIGQEVIIKSTELNEERPIWVYLPEGYITSPQKQYPVLYMLDGAFHFHHVTGSVQVLAKRRRIPEMIVVAIPYLDDQRRNRDLTPVAMDGRPPVAAADKFLAFIKNEVIAHAEKNYRTKPYRMLFGHSLAGMFSINTLIEEPELFNAHFAISPSVYWADRFLFKKIAMYSLDESKSDRHLYLSAAGGDRDQIRLAVIDFSELVDKNTPEGLKFHYSYLEKENHGSIVHRVFYDNIEKHFRDWSLSAKQVSTMSLAQLKQHYRRLSEDFGFDVDVPIRFALTLAQHFIDEKENQKAVEVANFVLGQDSNEPEAHFTIGYVHFVNQAYDLAKDKFETSLGLVDESDPYYQLYRYYLVQVSEKIEN